MFNRSKDETTPQEVIGMNIGKNISALRKKNNLTQEDLANRLGVSPQAVSKWENESSCPDISLLPEIAELFGVTVDDLLKKSETDIVETPVTDTKNSSKSSSYKSNPAKKRVCIVITQPNGKVSTVNIPFKLVETGLKLGNKFGLEEKISKNISEFLEAENLGEVLTVDGENGETVVIRIE